MSLFNKFFKKVTKTSAKEIVEPIKTRADNNVSLDETFVKNFISKGGKFLYCTNLEETKQNLVKILQENQWNSTISFDQQIDELLLDIKSAKTKKIIDQLPFFTFCESLIASDGSIMFSSKQLQDKKLNELPNNFIVLAKTSQIVKNAREGLSGIRNRAQKNSPTIICSVKDFIIHNNETDFMTYGNTNSKTLYLLLLEDL